MVAIDERRLEPLRSARGSLAVQAEACTSRAWPGECLGNHEVDRDALRAHPPAWLFSKGEAPGGEEVADERPFGEFARGNGEIGIRCVLGDRHVGVARMEVDRLRADEDDRVAMLGERLRRVEQPGASSDVERIRHARHPRFPASTPEARLLRSVPAPAR